MANECQLRTGTGRKDSEGKGNEARLFGMLEIVSDEFVIGTVVLVGVNVEEGLVIRDVAVERAPFINDLVPDHVGSNLALKGEVFCELLSRKRSLDMRVKIYLFQISNP